MSKFSDFFIKAYPQFKEKVLEGNYEEALAIYLVAYQRRVEGKKNQADINQVYSAAFDGFNRHGSKREQDLREWVDDDNAFNRFFEFFRSKYGKEGICRVSNKSRSVASVRVVKEEGPYERFLKRRHLRELIYKLSRNKALGKKKLYEQIEGYIRDIIISPNKKALTAAIKKDLIKERDDIFEYWDDPFLVSAGALLSVLMIRIENIENSIFSLTFNYLRWYAARYINKRCEGNNIPTNALTTALKKSPLLFLILNRQEMKFFLHSFLQEKRYRTATEGYNAGLILVALYGGYEDDTLEKMTIPESLQEPKKIEEAKALIHYREKVIALIEKMRPFFQYLDKRMLSAIDLILKSRYPFLILLPKHKTFIDNLTDERIEEKEECVRVLMKLVGIYSFSSRIKYMSRYSYYSYYQEQKLANAGEVRWIRVPDPSLEYFVLSVDDENRYYDFNNCLPSKYVSYIETVLSLYPREEYVYIKPEYSFPADAFDTYLTFDGYTLARYNFKGELCTEPLKGNCVKRITDPNFIPEYYRLSKIIDEMDEYFKLDTSEWISG